jgi:hypothetical protein
MNMEEAVSFIKSVNICVDGPTTGMKDLGQDGQILGQH